MKSITEIVLLAIIGAATNQGWPYWMVFGIFCFCAVWGLAEKFVESYEEQKTKRS